VLELRNARDDLTTTLSPGRPRRAVVDGVELAEVGPTNATTTLRDRAHSARVVAREGAMRLRATLAGHRVSDVDRRATDDLWLAVVPAAELLPEVRTLAACHRLLPSQKVTN